MKTYLDKLSGFYGRLNSRALLWGPAFLAILSLGQNQALGQPRDYFLENLNGPAGFMTPFGEDRERGSNIGFDYVSLPPVVSPGQQVPVHLQWSFLNPANGGAVIYMNAFGNWQPNTELARLVDGELVGGTKTVQGSFDFVAPTTPGSYRIRIVFAESYAAVTSFYGAPPGDADHPGVGAFAEIAFTVKAPPSHDYFLENLSGSAGFMSPFGAKRQRASNVGFDYISLPPVVNPGQEVPVELQWGFLNPAGPGAVIYLNAFGDWQPGAELARLADGELADGTRTVQKGFTFTAPAIPGVYRIRVPFVEAFAAVTNFYGGPLGDASSPGVGAYSEVVFTVKPPPAHDYFLDYLTNSAGYMTPFGEDRERDSNIGFDHVSLPPVVAPGQQVPVEVQWSYLNPGNSGAIVYLNVFGDWQPTAELARLVNGEAVGNSRTVQASFDFMAPTVPGTYRLRFPFVEAFAPVHNFYGGVPAGPSDPGVGAFCEFEFRVAAPGTERLQDGVVAYYPLDGNATNILGTGNDGVLHSVTPAPDRFGTVGGTCHFDGTNAAIDFPSGPAISPTGSVTYAYWLVSTYDGLYTSSEPGAWNWVWWVDRTFETDPTFSLALMTEPYGQFWFAPRCDVTMYPTNREALTGGTLTPHVWQHIAMVRDYAKGFRLYVDGVMVGSEVYDNGSPLTLPPIKLGRHAWNGDMGLIGNMDDLRIYSRALDSTEVAALYYDGPVWLSATPQRTVVAPGGSASLCATAVGTPPFSYQWFFNGTAIAGQNGACLNLAGVQPSHAGTYSVVVCNPYGCVTNSTEVSVLALKQFAGLVLSGTVGTSYRVECREALSGTNTWQTLTNLTLTANPTIFFDMESPNHAQRYYRAVPLP